MTTREVWDGFKAEWPKDAWDYFMRLDTISKNRDCLAPELSRNHNFGQKGTTVNKKFYDKHIATMKWHEGGDSDDSGGFGEDLGYLDHDTFLESRKELVARATVLGRWPDAQAKLLEKWGASAPGVWLVSVEGAAFPKLAKTALKLMDSNMRTGFHGLIVLKRAGQGEDSVFLIADERKCDFLPEGLLRRPAEGFRAVPAQELDQSCDTACGHLGLRCDASHFEYVNRCSALKEHFPCEDGCQGGVVGPDIPNYQDSRKKLEFYHKCLTTETNPSCGAKHMSGKRLCPCVPLEG